jgi:hypothetical protein
MREDESDSARAKEGRTSSLPTGADTVVTGGAYGVGPTTAGSGNIHIPSTATPTDKLTVLLPITCLGEAVSSLTSQPALP